MIITWDLSELDVTRPELLNLVKHAPSPYNLQYQIANQLKTIGVLSERDLLHLHVIPIPKSSLRILVLLGIYLQEDLTAYGGLSYEMRELGRIEYPTLKILCDYTNGQLSQLHIPLITTSQISVVLVHYLLQHGCVRVRTRGGAYYVPEFAQPNVEEILQLLESCGMHIRRIPIENGSKILMEIAQDAINSFRQAMTELIRKIRETKQEKVRQRALSDLKQLREFYHYYLQLFQELGGEIKEERIEAEVTIEAFATL